MLIDLSRFGPLTIDPAEYITTLAVRIDAPLEHPECGVFAGRHQAFDRSEEGNLATCIEDDEGTVVFLLDRPVSMAQVHLSNRWTYAASGWEGGVYVEHPYVWTLVLQELSGNEPGDDPRWSVSLQQHHGPVLTLILPEYRHGAVVRGVYTPIVRGSSDQTSS